MKTYAKKLKRQLTENLKKSSVAYLKTGLELFHKCRYDTDVIFQPAFGNLSIAIELMMKYVIADMSPLLLFKNLPIELEVLFLTPEKIDKSAIPSLGIDLKNFEFPTVNIERVIKLFKV